MIIENRKDIIKYHIATSAVHAENREVYPWKSTTPENYITDQEASLENWVSMKEPVKCGH